MAIKPNCEVVSCGRELTEFGAILFSPPDKDGMVKKQHVCVDCYSTFQSRFFKQDLGIEAEKLATNLEAGAAFLEACSTREYINWALPTIERKYTIVEILRQGSDFIRKNKVPSSMEQGLGASESEQETQRSPVIVIVAVFALALLGTAGAWVYHYFFG